MPKIGKVRYPYSPAGLAAAKKAKGKMLARKKVARKKKK
jgi:hypothetical protein